MYTDVHCLMPRHLNTSYRCSFVMGRGFWPGFGRFGGVTPSSCSDYGDDGAGRLVSGPEQNTNPREIHARRPSDCGAAVPEICTASSLGRGYAAWVSVGVRCQHQPPRAGPCTLRGFRGQTLCVLAPVAGDGFASPKRVYALVGEQATKEEVCVGR